MDCEAPSAYRYNHRQCRCDGCKEANRIYQQEYQIRRGRVSQRAEDVKARRLAADPVNWMNDAACSAPDIPTNTFFVEETNHSTHAYDDARRICMACPVQSECLEYAFRHHIHDGFWGGLSPRQRREVARRRRKKVAA